MFDTSDSGRDIFDDVKVIKLTVITWRFCLGTTRQTYVDIVSYHWVDEHHMQKDLNTYLRSLHYRHTGKMLLFESTYTAAHLFSFFLVCDDT